VFPNVPITLIADTAAPTPFVFTPVFGFNLVVGPGVGSPLIICDGLGIFGPAITTGATTHYEDLSTFGVNTVRGVFRTSGLALPPLGITVSLMAVFQDPTSPTSYNVTHVSGPYTF
jgi:hypothetical protein